jgi:hypothetical protein
MLKVLDKGRLIYKLPTLSLIQDRAKNEIAVLPLSFRSLTGSEKPPVKLSEELENLANSLWDDPV